MPICNRARSQQAILLILNNIVALVVNSPYPSTQGRFMGEAALPKSPRSEPVQAKEYGKGGSHA